jgi:hypothetical protein
VEKLLLSSAAAIDGTGNGLANTLVGNGADNVLDGASGADVMAGGAGNDTYIVDNAADRANEAAAAGTDSVVASASFVLRANVENLTLTGGANLNATGNALDNVLTGNGGINILNGGAGADSMAGGAGNDVYIVDNAGDAVTELPGGGTDQVRSFITYSLGADVERLALAGNAEIDGAGNALDNRITGNAAANLLDGGEGKDTIVGGAGNDTLLGGAGNDGLDAGHGNDVMSGGTGADGFHFHSAPGAADADVVSDFVSGADRIFLDHLAFTGSAHPAPSPRATRASSPARAPLPAPTRTTASSTTPARASSTTTPTARAPEPRSSSAHCKARRRSPRPTSASSEQRRGPSACGRRRSGACSPGHIIFAAASQEKTSEPCKVPVARSTRQAAAWWRIGARHHLRHRRLRPGRALRPCLEGGLERAGGARALRRGTPDREIHRRQAAPGRPGREDRGALRLRGRGAARLVRRREAQALGARAASRGRGAREHRGDAA